MKQIILVRHAKASDTFEELTDIERPLSKRGKMEAIEMAKRLSKKGVTVDELLASSARRAKKTARRMAPAFDIGKKEIVLKKGLYLADPDELRSELTEVLKKHDSVMLVGHNPGLTQLLAELCGKAPQLPTCGAAVVEVKKDAAAKLKKGCGTLVHYDFPGNRA